MDTAVFGTILALDTSDHFCCSEKVTCRLKHSVFLNTKKVFSEVMDLMSSRVILCLATRKNTDYVLVSFYRLNFYASE